jgi:hypothetical protein
MVPVGYRKMVRKIPFASGTQILSLWPNDWINDSASPLTTTRKPNAPYSAYLVPIHISLSTISDIVLQHNNNDDGTRYNIFDRGTQERFAAIPLLVDQVVACSIPDFTPDVVNPTCDLYVEIYYQTDFDQSAIRRLLCMLGVS